VSKERDKVEIENNKAEIENAKCVQIKTEVTKKQTDTERDLQAAGPLLA